MDELYKLKNYIKNKNIFLFKDFLYFKNRYLLYRNHDYLINKFKVKNHKSFFILKIIKDKSNLNYIILDHFGSNKIKSKHLFNLIEEQNDLIFLTKRKINKPKYKF